MVVLSRDPARLSTGFINTNTWRAGMAHAPAVTSGPYSLPVMSVASPCIDIGKFGRQSVQREPQGKADQCRRESPTLQCLRERMSPHPAGDARRADRVDAVETHADSEQHQT
ncbi:hypothetical protein P3T22_003440 [Paraburkholderia sp. GAS348]